MKLPASTLLVYALVFCTELGQSMLFPLLPGLADEFALSDARTGAVLAASTLATVAAGVRGAPPPPAGPAGGGRLRGCRGGRPAVRRDGRRCDRRHRRAGARR